MEKDYEYVITKSVWKAFDLWGILMAITVIPLVIRILILKFDRTYFYENRIIARYGVLSKHVTETAFVGISAISVDQSLIGRILGFGDISIDIIGKWRVTIKGAKKPMKAKEFLNSYIVEKSDVTAVLHN